MKLGKFKQQAKQLKKNVAFGWELLFTKRLKDDKNHPINYKDLECAFITNQLKGKSKQKILNVGSYSRYIIGLLSKYHITTLDVYSREPFTKKEKVVTEDIKDTTLPDESFDVIISTSAVEHFGLGRYGDEIDLDADKKAFEQFKRLLKPNGLLIFTTTIKKGESEVCFNANRTYTKEIIDSFSDGFTKETEEYIGKKKLEFCQLEDITDKKQTWDIYCGCWRKL